MSPCKHCGQDFRVKGKHAGQKYCSTACRDAAKIARRVVECAWCKKPVVRKRSRADRLANAFCCKECLINWRKTYGPRGEAHVQHVQSVQVECDACGRILEKQPSKVRSHNFCSPECRAEWQRASGYMTGPNNPTWRGGFDGYRGPNWREQRRAAMERDHHTCQRCGATNKLQVHHIQPWVTFSHYHEANQLENLVTLCVQCHKTTEWEYWREHPELIRLYPDTRRIHTCRKCGKEYIARSPHSLDCDDCTTSFRRILALSKKP